ncbi:tRNA (cytidine(34)-2'-O)-methyltransferase [Telmatospirillum siberiense]|uniref:tRNA (cytidine(34)-2'-O)-methyltransferase n=1 Tax=Telmatospirillum siberiense TaxID=382514 RepID=A0A2N3PU55_9PROT|nr:tRNA (cytidine(34)-2'-O)-methyltransferase [Telmatospirillum siberiense]PKU23917.1 tRNA methyltransferase [Telmatospirillum siberiense]
MRIALYQPDIPQNTGTILRLAACFGVGVDVIEPCGFVWDDRRLRRAGMDYLELAQLRRHESWTAFLGNRPAGRLVLLSTRADAPHFSFAFRPDDILLLGRESAGVPDEVHDLADERLRIPMVAGARSLNVALSAALVLGEALRQTDGFPAPIPGQAAPPWRTAGDR